MCDKISVLHIEDNPADARLMRECLREVVRPEFHLTVVARLDEALRAFDAQHFDVVLLDLSLPDAQGLESVTRFCEATTDRPIVVLTGLDDETLAVQAVQVGAEDYLIKGRLDGISCARAIRYAIERHRSRVELRSQSLRDELTGLYNRRGFLALAEPHLRMAYRERSALVLLFCDLDELKSINDTHGHAEGDRAIVTASRILRETLRATDLIARLGGDEFTALLLDGSGAGISPVLARLWERIDSAQRFHDLPYRLSMSIGVARREPGTEVTVFDLLAEADRALYDQKRGRREIGTRTPQAPNTTIANAS